MKHFIYTIYDVKSEGFNLPIFAKTDQQAIRSFKDICTDPEHPVCKHAEDYSLFRIGTFNDSSGMVEGEMPECIVTALELKQTMTQTPTDQLGIFTTGEPN